MQFTDIAVFYRIGFQNDGGGQHHAVIADTPHGRIPGKAKNGTCWYAYGGKEHITKEFLWVRIHFSIEHFFLQWII